MKKIVELNMRPLFGALLMLVLVLFSGCEKSATRQEPVYEAKAYIIGYHPAVGDNIITTPFGKGRGFLIETVGAKPDTLMMYGIPANMFDMPDEWIHRCTGDYLLPEEVRKNYKIQISYQASAELLGSFPCNAQFPSGPRKYFINEYITVKAKKID